MDGLYRKAIAQTFFGLIFFVVIIFFPAGTFHYWQGWLFLVVFSASTTGFTVYLALRDRSLLERRLKAGPQYEKEWSQKVIVSLVFVSFFAFIIFPSLDHRYGFSPVTATVSLIGDAIIVLSFLSIFWVIKTNTWAASNIRVEEGQRVIESGPYAYVRHPMYAGATLLFVGIPLALGSWWTLALIVLFLPILIWRLLDEERILCRDLRGYAEYTRKVRYRLIPCVW